MRARAWGLRLVLVVVGAVALLSLFSGMAFANIGYVPAGSGSFGLAEEEGVVTPFEGANGVGVDNSAGPSKGDVYVSARGNSTVYEFSPENKLLASVELPGVALGELSVAETGPSAGDVYVSGENNGNGVVYRFAPGLASHEELISGLQSPSDVAVDAVGDLFVSEESALKVLKFNSAGQPVDANGIVVGASENTVAKVELSLASGLEALLVGVAVDPSGSTLYAANNIVHTGIGGGSSETVKYGLSAGGYVSEGDIENEATVDLGGVAVSSSGDVYIGGFEEVLVYEPSGTLISRVPGRFISHGLALDNLAQKLYVASAGATESTESNLVNRIFVYEGGERPQAPVTESYSGLVGSQVTLSGTLEGGETGYYFEYNPGPHCEKGSKTAVTPASGIQQVHLELKELKRLTKYSYCIVAANHFGVEAGASDQVEVGEVQPTVLGESVSSVTSHTATVTAEVNPEGIPTSYYFEYGRGASYGTSTAQFSAGSGETPVSVTAALKGLDSGVEYHFRVVAVNEIGSNFGTDSEFATYGATPAGLPDGRTYEMVTSANNPFKSEVYETTAGWLTTAGPFEASADGNAVVYMGLAGAGGTGSSGTGATEGNGNQYRATRSAGSGWEPNNITPAGVGIGNQYLAFSTDLSAGVIASRTEPPLQNTTTIPSTIQGYSEIYETRFGEDLFRPFFTVTPPNREAGFSTNGFETIYAGASADFGTFIFESNDALVKGTTQSEEELATTTKTEGEIAREIVKLEQEKGECERRKNRIEEERREGQLQGTALEEAERELAQLTAREQELSSQINSKSPLDNHRELYMSTGSHVSLVNVLPDGTLAVGAKFGDIFSLSQDAGKRSEDRKNLANVISADGSKVFWSSPTIERGVYVRVDGTRTEAVSAGRATYWGASVNGRFAYYVEKGQLWRFDVESGGREEITPPEPEVSGVIGVNQTGEEGAYVYFTVEGALGSGEENAEKQKPEEGEDNLYVSEPDPAHPGQHVSVFIAPLESGDKSDWEHSIGARRAEIAPDGRSIVYGAGSGSEVYDYRVADGRTFCVSCRPQASGGKLTPSANPVFMRRWISEDGDRVFFESDAPLVLNDVNGGRDVYEWEPDGTGACEEVEGCVYLLSGGIESTAFFADASAGGNDVFMATRQRLSPEDQNEFVDLYDARVDGVRTVTPPACTGTGCQGAPVAAPIFATPSSVTFTGVGNFESPSSTDHRQSQEAKGLTRGQKLTRALAVSPQAR